MDSYTSTNWMTQKRFINSRNHTVLQRLKNEEIENLNRSITSRDWKSNQKAPHTKKVQSLHRWILSNIQRLSTYSSQTIPKEKKLTRRTYFLTHFMRLTLLWYQNQTETTQKRKSQATTSDDHRCEKAQQTISELNSTIHQKDHASW